MTMVNIPVEVFTVKGDALTLSVIAARRYRAYLPGYVERTLDINYGLAAKGACPPVGTKIALPAPLPTETAQEILVVRLWD